MSRPQHGYTCNGNPRGCDSGRPAHLKGRAAPRVCDYCWRKDLRKRIEKFTDSYVLESRDDCGEPDSEGVRIEYEDVEKLLELLEAK